MKICDELCLVFSQAVFATEATFSIVTSESLLEAACAASFLNPGNVTQQRSKFMLTWHTILTFMCVPKTPCVDLSLRHLLAIALT